MSSQQEKPKAIDPLDYEAVISKLGDELKEDPLRDLLLFPDNDFLVSVSWVVWEPPISPQLKKGVCVCLRFSFSSKSSKN